MEESKVLEEKCIDCGKTAEALDGSDTKEGVSYPQGCSRNPVCQRRIDGECGNMKVLKSKLVRYKENRVITREIWSWCELKDEEQLKLGHEMLVARNYHGKYIGSVKFARTLWHKYGIMPETISPESGVCSIGFSARYNKWFGWSHRALYGFTIGSKVKKGDCAYVPSNRQEYIEELKDWYNDEFYKNVEISEEDDHILIKYDVVRKDDPILIKYGADVVKENYKIIRNEYKEPLDIKYGKGEWVAETLEDAKQMAIDFARSVS